jgi:ATP-binding cassette subfamily B protein
MRYLKPFVFGLLLAVVMLFIQAICELNLPNLMSSIVNVGIQRGGIEEDVPYAISQDGYSFIQAFMDDDDKAFMEKNYHLVSGSDKDVNNDNKPYSDTYPAAKDAGIHALNETLTAEDREHLSATFGTATWTMVNVLREVQAQQDAGTLESTIAEQAAAQPELAVQLQMLRALGGLGGDKPIAGGLGQEDGSAIDIQSFDFAEIYKLQPLLDLLPSSILENARSEAKTMDPSLRGQSGTLLVAGFYRDLGVDMVAIAVGYIGRIGIYMLLITLLSGVATVLVSFLSSRIAAAGARNLRKDVFEKVVRFGNAEFDTFSTASLITRSTNDITQIQMLLTMGIRLVFYAPIMGIGGVVMALDKSVSMSWIIGVAVVLIIGIMLVLMAVVMPKFKVIQLMVDRLNLVARETLNGLMVIRAFGRSDFERKRFEGANQDLTKTNLFVQRAMAIMMPVMMLIMNGLTVLIIWVGAQNVAAAQMQVGDIMAYMQYAMQIIMSFLMVSMIFIFIPRAAVSAGRIADVLDTKPSINDPAAPRHIDASCKGLVEFRNVSFRYAGANEDALSDISFVAQPGQTTAFIGSTGSGKSTIINLIPRFYDATAGEVLVSGANVRDLTQHELRSHIGYVPQKSVLMAGTIESNIAYGNEDLSPEQLRKVAEVAQALDFIEEKDEAFDTEVAQGGANVSGGQRQRLSIARALAVNPDILLFDDSFSALDFKTDATLRHALAAYIKDATFIVVAQRVSTIMDADRIYVVDEGRVVGSGTHRELLASCEAYFEIASSQLSEKELQRDAR